MYPWDIWEHERRVVLDQTKFSSTLAWYKGGILQQDLDTTYSGLLLVDLHDNREHTETAEADPMEAADAPPGE